MLTHLPSLKTLLDQYALNPRKGLGQNFLLDLNICERITRTIHTTSADTLIEVGPGPGGLTRTLLTKPAQQIIVIEPDDRCVQLLTDTLQPLDKRLHIIAEDALQLPLHTLGQTPRHLVSNLPYHLSTRLLCQWLPYLPQFTSLTLMFQKEVALRLSAPVNTEHYSRLSVMTQIMGQVEPMLDLGPQVFFPAPKVDSRVVRITPHKVCPSPDIWFALEHLVKHAFQQRRKMIKSSLKTILIDPIPLLKSCHIDPQKRAEAITVAEYLHLLFAWKPELAIVS